MGNKQLMRETVFVTMLNGGTVAVNTVFDIDIPEGYALELHNATFIDDSGTNPVANRISMYLSDDPDLTAAPGHSAESVIVSTVVRDDFTTSGRTGDFKSLTMDCHRTLLVQPPNFIGQTTIDPGVNRSAFCRIWFDFVKVSPKEILDLLRQMTY